METERKRHIFQDVYHILAWSFLKGEKTRMDHTNTQDDLDDLIFDKEDGGPSER